MALIPLLSAAKPKAVDPVSNAREALPIAVALVLLAFEEAPIAVE